MIEDHNHMRIVLAVLFAVLSLVHLYACYFKLNRLRAATKPGLLLLLAVFYAAYAPLWKPTVFLALLFGMAGDILLITNGRQARFVVGAVCFSIGHILYSYTLYYMTGAFAESPGLWLPLALALPYAAAVALVARGLFPYIRERHLRALMPVYLGLVGVVNVGAWLTFLAALRANLQMQAFAARLLHVHAQALARQFLGNAYLHFRASAAYRRLYAVLPAIAAEGVSFYAAKQLKSAFRA